MITSACRIALPLALLASASALAEPASDELTEITVTAQRRLQSAQDVPISITALSGEQLRDFGVTSTPRSRHRHAGTHHGTEQR